MNMRLLVSLFVLVSMASCTAKSSTTPHTATSLPMQQVPTPAASATSAPAASLPAADTPLVATIPPADTAAPPLPAVPGAVIQPDDLAYLGAFRLPGASGGSNWEYSGRGLTYFPRGDPGGVDDGYPGSLFGVGHDQQQYVSEISIPAPVLSRNLEYLNTAQTLQPFADITGGMFGETEMPRLGIQYLPTQAGQTSPKLHFVHGQHFQDFEPSHGFSELDLANPQPAGPWNFGGYTNYVTSDYLFEIPESWAAFIPGAPRLVTGRFREGVWGGRGPTLLAYNPSVDGLPLANITPLLLYGVQEPGLSDIISDETMQISGYNQDDSWWGGAWLTSGEKSAVIFVGTKGLGKSWYGFANGVVWAYDCADTNPPTCPQVPERPFESRGYWAEDYQPQIIFYNPADLIAVTRGQIPTWSPQPYAVLDLTSTFFDPRIRLEDYKTDIAGAIAYDREHGLLYVIERLADGYQSIVHVWEIQ